MTAQQLPKGWQMVKFGDIAKHISKRVEPSETELNIYVGLEHLDPDSLKIKRHGVPSDVAGQKLLVKKGQIIFGKRRAYQRKVAVADWDCICSAHAMVLEENHTNLVPGFLPFFMQSDSFMSRAIIISEGSLSPTIKWKSLSKQEFPFPNKNVQNSLLKILEKTRRLESLLSECEHSRASLNDTLVLHETKSNVQVQSLKAARELIPDSDWKMYSLHQLANEEKNSFAIGPFGSDLVVSDFRPSGNPVIFVRDIKPNNYNWVSNTFIDSVKFKSLKAHHVKSGDVIVTKMGLPPGIATVYPAGEPDGIITADVIRIRPNSKIVHPEYLAYVVNSKLFKQQVRMITAGQTRPKLTLSDFKKLVVYLPRIEIQEMLVAKFHAVRDVQIYRKPLSSLASALI